MKGFRNGEEKNVETIRGHHRYWNELAPMDTMASMVSCNTTTTISTKVEAIMFWLRNLYLSVLVIKVNMIINHFFVMFFSIFLLFSAVRFFQ